MPTLLAQNSKIAKSATAEYVVFNFGIPAWKSKTGMITCPAAGICGKQGGCYALQGPYRFSNVASVYEWRLTQAETETFPILMQSELDEAKRKAAKRGRKVVIRIHDSGDFYSVPYLRKWLAIIVANEDVYFYAYTKQVRLFSKLLDKLPSNFRVIFSEGGIFDDEIDTATQFHSRVFPSREALLAAGYADASENDLVAGMGDNIRIGLIYHGADSKQWTTDEQEKVS
jgi:hypothetical protein